MVDQFEVFAVPKFTEYTLDEQKRLWTDLKLLLQWNCHFKSNETSKTTYYASGKIEPS